MFNIKISSLVILTCAASVTMIIYLQIIQLQKEIRDLEINRYTLISQSNLQNVPVEDDILIIYNRVPKTGSTSFVGVAYDLCKKNNFHVLHVNVSGNNHVLSLTNQYSFVNNVTNWSAIKPAMYHGHFAYLDFAKYSSIKPLYVNIVRKPLDRLVSYYYFLRYGDNFRPYLIRKKHGNTMTFDECVEKDQTDCDPNNMWLQIPFFCGHAVNCWKPGNKWALVEAKKNLINNYILVGVTEELHDFIAVLEAAIPRVFRGSSDYFAHSNKSHLRRTAQKVPPKKQTIEKIQKSVIWQMENEFYEFALDHFRFMKKITFGDRTQNYFYEKIRPKRT